MNTQFRRGKRRRQYSSDKDGSTSEHVNQRRLEYLLTPLPPSICGATCGFTPCNNAPQGTGRKRYRRHVDDQTSSSNDLSILSHMSMPSIALTCSNLSSFTPETTTQPDWMTLPGSNQSLNMTIPFPPDRASAHLSHMNENSSICSYLTEEPVPIEYSDRNLHGFSSGLSGSDFDETAMSNMDETSLYCTPSRYQPRITDGFDDKLWGKSSGMSALVSDENTIMDMSSFKSNSGAVLHPEPSNVRSIQPSISSSAADDFIWRPPGKLWRY